MLDPTEPAVARAIALTSDQLAALADPAYCRRVHAPACPSPSPPGVSWPDRIGAFVELASDGLELVTRHTHAERVVPTFDRPGHGLLLEASDGSWAWMRLHKHVVFSRAELGMLELEAPWHQAVLSEGVLVGLVGGMSDMDLVAYALEPGLPRYTFDASRHLPPHESLALHSLRVEGHTVAVSTGAQTLVLELPELRLLDTRDEPMKRQLPTRKRVQLAEPGSRRELHALPPLSVTVEMPQHALVVAFQERLGAVRTLAQGRGGEKLSLDPAPGARVSVAGPEGVATAWQPSNLYPLHPPDRAGHHVLRPRLWPARRLQVVFEDGRPAAGATVRCRSQPGDHDVCPFVTRADDQGWAWVPDDVVVEAWLDGLRVRGPRRSRPDGKPHRLTLKELVPTCSVAGSDITLPCTDIPDAPLGALERRHDVWTVHSSFDPGLTDDAWLVAQDGSVVGLDDDLVPGTYDLFWSPQSLPSVSFQGLGAMWRAADVRLEPGRNQLSVPLEPYDGGSRVMVTVVDAQGAPIPGVPIGLRGRAAGLPSSFSVRTDFLGRATVPAEAGDKKLFSAWLGHPRGATPVDSSKPVVLPVGDARAGTWGESADWVGTWRGSDDLVVTPTLWGGAPWTALASEAGRVLVRRGEEVFTAIAGPEHLTLVLSSGEVRVYNRQER